MFNCHGPIDSLLFQLFSFLWTIDTPELLQVFVDNMSVNKCIYNKPVG